MENIEITHEWSGQQWDWPLQHNDGVVKVHNTPEKWEVGLDVAFFTPNEIEVKVVADHLNIHCKHEARSDVHGSVSREINRSYKLPNDVNTGTIKSHLTQNGVLRVSAQKK
ncbi:hypothetical protein niasHS_002675 [Heterodera schachtii]|uniref:SHSP domain-containing protein n=1 Tax=Heterodera schachtii TaxID=97005 RepID=A0ABD2K257_HETSC